MIRVKLLLFSLLFIAQPLKLSSDLHEFYVSITMLEYVEEKQSVQIISRIFIDDMEKLIRERYDESITLAVEDEPQRAVKYLEKYLREKLTISINGSVQKMEFIGREYENDILYVYLEIEGVEEISSLTVSNEVLFDLYEEQQNIVRTKIYGKNKSFILIKENAKGVLNFEP